MEQTRKIKVTLDQSMIGYKLFFTLWQLVCLKEQDSNRVEPDFETLSSIPLHDVFTERRPPQKSDNINSTSLSSESVHTLAALN